MRYEHGTPYPRYFAQLVRWAPGSTEFEVVAEWPISAATAISEASAKAELRKSLELTTAGETPGEYTLFYVASGSSSEVTLASAFTEWLLDGTC